MKPTPKRRNQPCRSRHNRGLTTMELLVGLAITSGVIGGILFAMQNTVRNQSAQSDLMLAETSLRRTQDILSQNLKSGTFAMITKADPQGVTLEFREKYTFDPTSAQKTGNTITLTAPDQGETINGQNVIVFNKAGQALLLENPTVTRASGTITVSAQCQNTIQDISNSTFTFTKGLSIALGRVLGEGFEADTLYTKVGSDNWAAISTKMQAFKIRYVYEALDGSQITDPPEMQANQIPKDSYSYGGKTYKLSTLIVDTSKTGQANPDLERTYASNIPLARSLMDQVSEISRCTDPTAQPKKGTGDLQVIVQGLPNGVNANLTVSGPGFSQSPTASKTYYGVNPGSYTLFTNTVTSGLTTYTTAETGSQNADVTPWSPATLTANYQKVQGKLKVTLAGLPSEVTPLLTWNGPENLTTKAWVNGSNPEMSVQPGSYSLTTTGLSYGLRYFNIKTFSCSGPSGICTQGSIPVGSDKTTTVNVTFEERKVPITLAYSTNTNTSTIISITQGTTLVSSPELAANTQQPLSLPGGIYSMRGVTNHNGNVVSTGDHVATLDARSFDPTKPQRFQFDYQYSPPPPPREGGRGFWWSMSAIGESACDVYVVDPEQNLHGSDCPGDDGSRNVEGMEGMACAGWGTTGAFQRPNWVTEWDKYGTMKGYRESITKYAGTCMYGDSGLYLYKEETSQSGYTTYYCANGPFSSPPGGNESPTAVIACPKDGI